MLEHRLSERLATYWNSMRKDELLPDFSRFNASTIDDIFKNCMLFTVVPVVENKPIVLNFFQIGERVKSLYTGDMVGRTFNSSQRHFQGAAIMRRVQEVIDTPAILMDEGQFINEKSKIVKYRSCLLPFGRDGRVTHILVGLSWREM